MEHQTSLTSGFQARLESIRDYINSLVVKRKDFSELLKIELIEALSANDVLNDSDLQENPTKEEEHQKQIDPEDVSDVNMEVASEEQDTYIPRDFEFGETSGETSHFAEIYPGFIGYFTTGKKSYFDKSQKLWFKRKQLSKFNGENLSNGVKKFQYASVVKDGLTSIALPQGATIDLSSLQGKGIEIFRDQNNCFYVKSNSKQYIAFDFVLDFYQNNSAPISADYEKIISGDLSDATKSVLTNLQGIPSLDFARALQKHILKTKKYSTKNQGTFRDKGGDYISNIDNSDIAECYSANSLFVALCREIGLAARLVEGHMIQSLSKDKKSHISNNTGHAWSEIWDEQNQCWIRFDATPTEKEDGKDSNQNMDNSGDNDADSNMQDGENGDSGDKEKNDSGGNGGQESGEEESSGGSGQDNKDNKNGGGSEGEEQIDNSSGDGQQQSNSGGQQSQDQSQSSGGGQSDSTDAQPSRTPQDILDEMIDKAKTEDLSKQADKINETLDKLENAKTKEEIKDIMNNSGLQNEAKDMIDNVGNQEILEQEKKEIENLDDERDVDKALKDSLLDEETKKKLNEYADTIKKKIEEQRKKEKEKMKKMGFSETELRLYKQYLELEKEVAGEIRRNIEELKKILPKKYHLVETEEYYQSGDLDTGKLVEFRITRDPRIFKRDDVHEETPIINMFETIVIDRSPSMGDFHTPGSPLREAVKAAIIRAKTLEYFDVQFSILFFASGVVEIMKFGEKFSDRRSMIPAKLMREAVGVSGTNISAPLIYAEKAMNDYSRRSGTNGFGNITFIGDGEPNSGLSGQPLVDLIAKIRKRYGLTAYYIRNSGQSIVSLGQYFLNLNGISGDDLIKYFGEEKSGKTVIVDNVKELTKKMVGAHNKNLRNIIQRYVQFR